MFEIEFLIQIYDSGVAEKFGYEESRHGAFALGESKAWIMADFWS